MAVIPPALFTESSTRINSAADAGREVASLARQYITRSARTGGVSGRSSITGCGDSPMCAASTRWSVRPWNGGWPASSSYAMQPNA